MNSSKVTPADLYCELLKRALTRAIAAKPRERHTLKARFPPKRLVLGALQRVLARWNLEMVRVINCDESDYMESGDSASNRAEDAESMVGLMQFNTMQTLIQKVIRSGVPGDLLEAGVWRGGISIFMKGVLDAHGDQTRKVWVVDSFRGLPDLDRVEDQGASWWSRGDMAVPEDVVRANFVRYGLLDDRVRFLKGYFCDSLPNAPISQLALLRIDADLYTSTMDALTHLYPKLSNGGYCVVDDYQNLSDCQRAVDQYRATNFIDAPVIPIDSRAVYWQRTCS
jgi:O-methyltransferase